MPQIVWQPNAGPQTRFLSSRADEALYGGAAGGGKSAALLALPLRWIHNPRFRGLYLRRETQYLGDAIDKSAALYPALGGRLVRTPRIVWTFPSGATIWLNHCEHEKDVRNYDGFEFSLALFDELTHFTERQYLGIRSRLRGTDPTLPYVSRAATNPGGEGHEWVFKRWGAWLDPTHRQPAAPAALRWYRGEDAVDRGTPDSLSRTFIPALLADNPHIPAEYRAKLLQLDPVRRAQLERGDWLTQPAKGLYFRRSKMPVVDVGPAQVAARIRYWDRAATEGGGDWTVGVRISRTTDGLFWVEDVVRVQRDPAGVEAVIRETSDNDPPGTVIGLEQDPGQAGKFEAAYYVRAFAGRAVKAFPKRVDKLTAAGPWSAQAMAGGPSEPGNVRLVRGAWNGAFLAEHEAFPEGSHDDQVDAASGGFAAVAGDGYAARMRAAMARVRGGAQ